MGWAILFKACLFYFPTDPNYRPEQFDFPALEAAFRDSRPSGEVIPVNAGIGQSGWDVRGIGQDQVPGLKVALREPPAVGIRDGSVVAYLLFLKEGNRILVKQVGEFPFCPGYRREWARDGWELLDARRD